MSEWECLYKGAYNDDGSLFFPERLTESFLDSAKRHMGSQFFSNQYLNKVVDEGNKPFKPAWLKYFDEIPKNVHRFSFIDPAISMADSADFTAVSVIAVDHKGHWYLEHCSRHKITPTQIIDLLFHVAQTYTPLRMGIEDVAFQKVLVYLAYEEMQKRNIWMPLEGIKPPNDKTKQMKILGLVPRFEFGSISIARHLKEFEQEFLDYAGERSKHDDMLDSLASLESMVSYPSEEKEEIRDVAPNHPDYERMYRLKLQRGDFRREQ